MKRLRWIPVIAYAALIFYLSSRPWPTQAYLPPGTDKVIHFAIYFFLGFGLVWAFRATHLKFSHHLMWMAALTGFLYGISDEIHQSFVPGREASVFDAVADGVGSVFGAWVAIFFARWLRKEDTAKSRDME